jgi:membrane protease YdiL (CAAX protease family)
MNDSSFIATLRANRSFWKNPVTVILSCLLLFFGAQILAAFMVAPFLPYVPEKSVKLTVFIAANLFALAGLLSLGMRMLGFTWKDLGVKRVAAKYMAFVVPVFVVYMLLSALFTVLATQLLSNFDADQVQELGFSATSTVTLVATFISLVLITPFLEEVIFRGVLFKGLRKRLPLWAAAFVTSIIFAVAHGQLNVAIDTFALSIFLCVLVEKSDSIWPAVALHMLKNGLAFVLLFIIKV